MTEHSDRASATRRRVPDTVARLLRALLCLGITAIPVLIPMAVARFTAPPPRQRVDVNMFGMGQDQFQSVLIAIAAAFVVALVANWLLRLGWAWIGIMLAMAVVVIAIASSLDLSDTIFGGLIIATPMVGGAATRGTKGALL